MIRKSKDGYLVLSESGKNLGGPFKTEAEARKRLSQVEFFKDKTKAKNKGKDKGKGKDKSKGKKRV